MSHTKTYPRRILAYVGVAAAITFFIGLLLDNYSLRLIVKPVPVLCMVLWIYLGKRDRFSTLVAIGLVFSAFGDILLEYSDSTFLAGVLAFLMGHILYTGAFFSRTRTLKLVYAVPFGVWGIVVFALLVGNLNSMTIPVGVYIAVICTMMWRAAAHMGTEITAPFNEKAGAAGAVSFGLSDTLLALNRWYVLTPIPEMRYLIIVLYWLGQFGITLSTQQNGLKSKKVVQ
jgi:alkenylglycerophosphocholine/alkenylglycerophosphoethanolamine hydrolase